MSKNERRTYETVCPETEGTVEFVLEGEFSKNAPEGDMQMACPMCGDGHIFTRTDEGAPKDAPEADAAEVPMKDVFEEPSDEGE